MGKLTRAGRNIRWIEKHCRIPEGEHIGRAVRLRFWQKKIIRGIYDGKTRRAIVSFGRKNGKTALAAFLLLLHLVGPEYRPNSQLVSSAQSRDQAAFLYNLAAKSARMSPTLAGFLIFRDTKKEIACPKLGTLYRALSADASTNLGASPVFAVHDELGEVRGPRSELYTAIEYASAAHDSPLSIIISTQAPTDGDLLSILIDRAKTDTSGRIKLFMYSAPLDLDPFSDKALRAANPAFGDFQNAAETRGTAADAKETPALENDYRNKILNQRVATASPFIAAAIWKANGGAVESLDGRDVFGGLDLAQRNDTTALIWLADGPVLDVEPHFWLPAKGLAERSKSERVPFDLWAEQGFLHTSPGATVNYREIAQEIMAARAKWNVRSIAYDPNMAEALWPLLEDLGMTVEDREELFSKIPQGYAGMSPCIGELQALLLEHRIRHGMHPVLTMHAANAVLHRGSVSDNFLLKKPSATARIDGMVALAMAAGRRAMILEDAPLASPWEDPEATVQVL